MDIDTKNKYYEFSGAKKCPFCGSDDIMIHSQYDGHLFVVYCRNCFIEQSGYTTESEAKEKWNMRVPEDD